MKCAKDKQQYDIAKMIKQMAKEMNATEEDVTTVVKDWLKKNGENQNK